MQIAWAISYLNYYLTVIQHLTKTFTLKTIKKDVVTIHHIISMALQHLIKRCQSTYCVSTAIKNYIRTINLFAICES